MTARIAIVWLGRHGGSKAVIIMPTAGWTLCFSILLASDYPDWEKFAATLLSPSIRMATVALVPEASPLQW